MITQEEWTPGPWGIGKSCDGTPAVTVPVHPSEGSGFVVAHVNRLRVMGSVAGCAEANARLIAAAPELYAALTITLNKWVNMVNSGDCGFWDPEKEPHVIAARAALNKARGIS